MPLAGYPALQYLQSGRVSRLASIAWVSFAMSALAGAREGVATVTTTTPLACPQSVALAFSTPRPRPWSFGSEAGVLLSVIILPVSPSFISLEFVSD
jgi:hypothetical protein